MKDLSLLEAGLGPLVISEQLESELNDEVFAVAPEQPFLISNQAIATTILMVTSGTPGEGSIMV